MAEAHEPGSRQASDSAQDALDTSMPGDPGDPGDPGAVEAVAADMQQLSADWQRIEEALRDARQATGPRDTAERLGAVREGCAAHLEELQRMRRKAIEALPPDMRGSILDTFAKFYDDLSAQIRTIDEELQRLRAEFNPLFRPPQ